MPDENHAGAVDKMPTDTQMIDWLGDPFNNHGAVILPAACYKASPGNMRGMIAHAMRNAATLESIYEEAPRVD